MLRRFVQMRHAFYVHKSQFADQAEGICQVLAAKKALAFSCNELRVLSYKLKVILQIIR